MSSPPPPLSDKPYDNYIKEKPAPAPPPSRERCANVYDGLMACLMKSKVLLPLSRANPRDELCSTPHPRACQCVLAGGTLRACVAAPDLEPECASLRHMLYQATPAAPANCRVCS